MQIVSTKLSIPLLRARPVARLRLFHKLDTGLECGFVLVSAPAGYGKSTLLSAWLRRLHCPGLWLSLDDGDNDPVRFLSYLAAAVEEIDPSAGAILESAVGTQPRPDPETLLTPFINQLGQQAKPFVVVLDDYHFIQDQEINRAVQFLLEHRPPALKLVIATRADPPLPLARLRARSQMSEVRQADLCFTIQEAVDFLSRTMELAISSEDAVSLTARTEGWIAGLQMAGLSLLGREDASGFIRSFSGEDRYVLDFLFDEVFMRQSGEIQDFLLKTSILEQLCASLCNAITLRDNSREILDYLERNNLFLISLDEQRKWYRYHHLFTDLLKSRFKLTAPDSIPTLHERASTWYAIENDLENAIDHALTAGGFELAAQLIERMIRQEEVLNNLVALREWIERLPAEILDVHPWLCVYRAWVEFETGQRENLEEQLQTVEKSAENILEKGDPQRQHIQGHIAALRAYIAFIREDVPQVLEMGQKALSLLPVHDRMRSSAAVVLGAAYWASGDVTQSEWAFRVAKEAALKISFPRAVPADCYIGIQQMKQGRFQDAIEIFKDGLRLATLPNGHETFLAGFPNVKLGDMYRERNDLVLASQSLARGVEQCVHLGQADVLTEAYICLGRYQLASGDLRGTFETIRKADQSAYQKRVDQYVLCWLDDLRIKTWLAAGNLEAARTWAKNSGLSPEGPFSYQHDLHHQNLARVLVAESALTGSEQAGQVAEVLLEKLIEQARQAGWVHEQIILRVLQADNYQAGHKWDRALQSLMQAVCLAEPGGYVRVFVDAGIRIRDLLIALEKILQGSQEPERLALNIPDEKRGPLQAYLSKLLAVFDFAVDQTELRNFTEVGREFSEKAPVAVYPLTEQLSTREQEVLNLLARGYSDKRIAASLVIARETVHKHLRNIYGKLGVHSRTEAVARAKELGLL